MKKLRHYLIYWAPPLLWMVLIFYFSSRQRVAVSEKYILNFLFFKALHVIEYAILYLLLFRAFYFATVKIPTKQKLVFPALISLFYAVSDELHQTFVPTREGKARDVFIDSIGILLMYSYIKVILSKVKKKAA